MIKKAMLLKLHIDGLFNHRIMGLSNITPNKFGTKLFLFMSFMTCLNNTCGWFYVSPSNGLNETSSKLVWKKTLFKLKISYCWRTKIVFKLTVFFFGIHSNYFSHPKQALLIIIIIINHKYHVMFWNSS